MTTELQNKEIRGVTWKQVVSLIVVVAAAVGLYFRLEGLAKDGLKQSEQNGLILIEMQKERKELVRINDLRLTKIELELAEARIRITNIENQINK